MIEIIMPEPATRRLSASFSLSVITHADHLVVLEHLPSGKSLRADEERLSRLVTLLAEVQTRIDAPWRDLTLPDLSRYDPSHIPDYALRDFYYLRVRTTPGHAAGCAPEDLPLEVIVSDHVLFRFEVWEIAGLLGGLRAYLSEVAL